MEPSLCRCPADLYEKQPNTDPYNKLCFIKLLDIKDLTPNRLSLIGLQGNDKLTMRHPAPPDESKHEIWFSKNQSCCSHGNNCMANNPRCYGAIIVERWWLDFSAGQLPNLVNTNQKIAQKLIEKNSTDIAPSAVYFNFNHKPNDHGYDFRLPEIVWTNMLSLRKDEFHSRFDN